MFQPSVEDHSNDTLSHQHMHVPSQLSTNVNSVSKLTFLTVTCFNGASSLCAAFRECSAEILHLFIQQISLSMGQRSPQSLSQLKLCFLTRNPCVFIPGKSWRMQVFRNLRTECTVGPPVTFEVCLPLGQKNKFKLLRTAIFHCFVLNNRTLWANLVLKH